ncbi:histidine phosphatase family protein [Crocosphaera sp. UHCC 0190]|uniref:histidine phosphatase family protein n=1 Tax=Crocosphaera sp. UHCC 0190 TaxID=3110246 RepID=UPI002B1F12A3|nr:histidine phosphatase family protein [Crocosphaera sp. UHCC 0190]MEA5510767.1 histidine phosphatase family protein [Crocosphaera sp. UHCC 0190]
MSLKLYFLRHGETTASQTGTYCGRLDIELTEAGEKMAEDFARFYQNIEWKGVYCSPLQRAIKTAKPLCDQLGMQMQLRPGLKEIYYGEWEGKTPDQVNREFHDDYVRWLADPGWNSPNGGEKGIDIARRSSEVLEEIECTHKSGHVLVVSHKATIRIMLCSLLGIDIGRYRDRIAMSVARVSIVEIAENGPLVHIMGDCSHLREELRHRHGT